MTPVKDIFLDSVKIIGKIEKLDSLRYGTTGLASFYFVLSLPNPKAKRGIYIPCTIYGNKAEELEKLVINRKIKLGDSLRFHNSNKLITILIYLEKNNEYCRQSFMENQTILYNNTSSFTKKKKANSRQSKSKSKVTRTSRKDEEVL